MHDRNNHAKQSTLNCNKTILSKICINHLLNIIIISISNEYIKQLLLPQ